MSNVLKVNKAYIFPLIRITSGDFECPFFTDPISTIFGAVFFFIFCCGGGAAKCRGQRANRANPNVTINNASAPSSMPQPMATPGQPPMMVQQQPVMMQQPPQPMYQPPPQQTYF